MLMLTYSYQSLYSFTVNHQGTVPPTFTNEIYSCITLHIINYIELMTPEGDYNKSKDHQL